MIELKTFGEHVFEISEEDIKKAVLKPSKTPGGKLKIFVAPSESVLIEVTDTRIKLVIGRNIPPKVYQHILGFAMSHGKRLELVQCENLRNLDKIDKLIELYNSEFSLFI